jgi:hypothetical protein
MYPPQVYATARKPERMRGLDRLGCTLIELDTTDVVSDLQSIDLQSIDAAVDQVRARAAAVSPPLPACLNPTSERALPNQPPPSTPQRSSMRSRSAPTS